MEIVMKFIRLLFTTLLLLFSSLFIFANEPEKQTSISEELERLYAEDQADRSSAVSNIDWEAISLRDEQREIRVKELLSIGGLGSGTEYYHAAMILQHASTPSDYLLAHDLCVIAISKGEDKAKWLAAASLDRFLVSVGRPQRFGTQFYSNKSFLPPKLAPIDPSVTDTLRRELDVPTLEEAKKRELEIEEEFYESRKDTKSTVDDDF
jgi:hypothetical protein